MRNRRRIFNNKRFGWAILLTLIVCFSAIILDVCTGNSAFATTSDEVVETNFFPRIKSLLAKASANLFFNPREKPISKKVGAPYYKKDI